MSSSRPTSSQPSSASSTSGFRYAFPLQVRDDHDRDPPQRLQAGRSAVEQRRSGADQGGVNQASLALENAQLLEQAQLAGGRGRTSAALHPADHRILTGGHRGGGSQRQSCSPSTRRLAELAASEPEVRRPSLSAGAARRRLAGVPGRAFAKLSFQDPEDQERHLQISVAPFEEDRPASCGSSSCRTSANGSPWRTLSRRRSGWLPLACWPPEWRTRSTLRSPASPATLRCCWPRPRG